MSGITCICNSDTCTNIRNIVSLPDCVLQIKYLEKQREVLQERWSMLKVEEDSEKDLEPIYLSYISRLLGQVNGVTKRNNQTQKNLLELVDSVNETKDKLVWGCGILIYLT